MSNFTVIEKIAFDLIVRSMNSSPIPERKLSEDTQEVILYAIRPHLGLRYNQEEQAEFERGMKKAWAQFNSQFE